MSIEIKSLADSQKEAKPVQELDKKIPHIRLADIVAERNSALEADKKLVAAIEQLNERISLAQNLRSKNAVSIEVLNRLIKKAKV